MADRYLEGTIDQGFEYIVEMGIGEFATNIKLKKMNLESIVTIRELRVLKCSISQRSDTDG